MAEENFGAPSLANGLATIELTPMALLRRLAFG
jgi:hypothetical protein